MDASGASVMTNARALSDTAAYDVVVVQHSGGAAGLSRQALLETTRAFHELSSSPHRLSLYFARARRSSLPTRRARNGAPLTASHAPCGTAAWNHCWSPSFARFGQMGSWSFRPRGSRAPSSTQCFSPASLGLLLVQGTPSLLASPPTRFVQSAPMCLSTYPHTRETRRSPEN